MADQFKPRSIPLHHTKRHAAPTRASSSLPCYRCNAFHSSPALQTASGVLADIATSLLIQNAESLRTYEC